MEIRRPVLSKIVVGSAGMGVADSELLERRAREVALIQGRSFPNGNDWAEAYRELHGRRGDGDDVAVWISGGPEMGRGDEAPEEEYPEAGLVGPRKAQTYVDGSESMGEELIREGVEEAEHERMLLAHFLEEEVER